MNQSALKTLMPMSKSITDITERRQAVVLPSEFLRGGVLHGVAICSNPVARNADDGLTLEVARLCTDGIRNGCSMLYGACARIAKDMGFRKIQTYILETESGASLKASGWKCEGIAGDINWQRCNSKRQILRDNTAQIEMFPKKKPPEVMKTRWAKYLVPEPWGGEKP